MYTAVLSSRANFWPFLKENSTVQQFFYLHWEKRVFDPSFIIYVHVPWFCIYSFLKELQDAEWCRREWLYFSNSISQPAAHNSKVHVQLSFGCQPTSFLHHFCFPIHNGRHPESSFGVLVLFLNCILKGP